LNHFLKQLAGFFIVEDTVLHTAADFASGAGAVDQLWADAMAQLRKLVDLGFSKLTDPMDMLTLKRGIDTFASLMSCHGYYAVPLFMQLEKTQAQYENNLLTLRGAALCDFFKTQRWQPVRVQDDADWVELIAPHARSLYPDDERSGEARASAPEEVLSGHHRFAFSELVPRLLAEAKSTILQYTQYTRAWPEFAARLTKVIDQLLRVEFRRALSISVLVDSRTIEQAVQLSADMAVLICACPELEDAIRAQLRTGAGVEGPGDNTCKHATIACTR
jgi:hypothetical protein